MQMRALATAAHGWLAAPVLALALLWPGAAAWGQPPPQKQCITLELFTRDGVQACTDARKFVEELVKRNGFLRVVVHDVVAAPDQMARVKELSAKYGVTPSVPTFFVCNRLMAGFNANTGREIEELCSVTVFTRDGCPRCAAAKVYLGEFKKKYPGLPVHDHEVTRTAGARERMETLTSRAKTSAASLPTFYAGGRILVGWSDTQTGANLEKVLKPYIAPWPAGKPALEAPPPGEKPAEAAKAPETKAPETKEPATKEPEKKEEKKEPEKKAAAVDTPRALSARGWAAVAAALVPPARGVMPAVRLAPAALLCLQAAESAPLEPTAAPLEPAAAPLEPAAEPLEPKKGKADPTATAFIPAAPLDPSGVLEPAAPLEPLEPLDPLNPDSPGSEEPQDIINLPYFGEVRASDLGMPLFTISVGLIDGFNPCAMWVLIFLLSVLVNLKDRWKIILIAGTFVFISGLAYFAFMAAWLNVFVLIPIHRPVQIALGLICVGAGAIHVKDFFAFKQGVSLSIPESAKPSIYKRVRSIVQSNNVLIALWGAITLAVLVNIVELLCTAGLPAMYTQILTMQGFPAWKNYLYLALYNLAYMFDDTVLLVIITATMSKHRLQEKEGRWLKFVSGAAMLALGLTMLFKPEWLA